MENRNTGKSHTVKTHRKDSTQKRGKLKIGDHWNAISIIALSQNNPLKAIAEFVENSIDAHAENITIIRGKKQGKYYLRIGDDGEGVHDFNYVATHIGDSIKRELKEKGHQGIQGEFGIGLLSFWTVGETLTLTSVTADGTAKRMKLARKNPGYEIELANSLLDRKGTDLYIYPLLPGTKQLHGEKIQNYLASELRDRITKSGVKIKIHDKTARKELDVEPRKFEGRLLHNLPQVISPFGEIYVEIYLNDPNPENKVGLYRRGTRVFESITKIDHFNLPPWTSGYFQGIIDVPFLQLTPGTRDGIIYDEYLESFYASLDPVQQELEEIIRQQKLAEEEKMSRNILNKVHRAFNEAFLHLPKEEYDWLEIYKRKKKAQPAFADTEDKGNGAELSAEDLTAGSKMGAESVELADGDIVDSLEVGGSENENKQKEFFEIPGPLYAARISPANSICGVRETKKLKIIARDKQKRPIDGGFRVNWMITEGDGFLDSEEGVYNVYNSTDEPGIVTIKAFVEQEGIQSTAEAHITVTAQLPNAEEGTDHSGRGRGLPGYTFKRAAGELWRSRYDKDRNIIIINNGHTDYLFATKVKRRQLRYICKLYSKELILANFPELDRDALVERLIELQVYTEENL